MEKYFMENKYNLLIINDYYLLSIVKNYQIF